MIKPDYLIKALKDLAKLQVILEEEGGPEQDGELFEQILYYQDTILKRFGLPLKVEYERLIFFNAMPTDEEISDRINQLHQAATTYLLSSAKSDLNILREAKKLQLDSFAVLPELKIKIHIYPMFVYDYILLENKDSVENVLNELRFANHPDILNVLGKLKQNMFIDPNEVIKLLDKIGLRYVHEFMSKA